MSNKPGDYCYIIILPEFDKVGANVDDLSLVIPFDTMPATITDTKQGVWQDTAIIARSAPLKTYQFSGARTISFALDFFISIEAHDTDGLDDQDALKIMKGKLNQLRGLIYPSTSTTMARPRKCILRIGDAFGMLAFCKQVSIIYRGDSPWNLNPMMAHHATVNLLLEETGEKLYSFQDIIIDQDFTDLAAVPGTEGIITPTGVALGNVVTPAS